MYSEDDYILISSLEHFRFCPRQCALIHLDCYWHENALTALGRAMHERVNTPGQRQDPGKKTEYSVPLASRRLGISGIADLIEYTRNSRKEPWTPLPVEYKHGKPTESESNEIQLCAESMCLEEMLEITIPAGMIYYGKDMKRHPVLFDQALRSMTEQIISEVHSLFQIGRIPSPVYSAARCDHCSLVDYCRPQDPVSCDSYMERFLCENC